MFEWEGEMLKLETDKVKKIENLSFKILVVFLIWFGVDEQIHMQGFLFALLSD